MTRWQNDAKCARPGMRPDDWFDGFEQGDTTYPEKARVAMAKRLCAGCPVILDCREFALREGIEYGVYGGLTAPQRARKLHAV